MQDIQHVVDAYYKDPAPARREAVVVAATPLVRSIIRRFKTRRHVLASYEDLQGVGLLGLLEALDRYEPAAGRFTSFAYRRIHGAVVDYLRTIDTLGRHQRQKAAQMQSITGQLQQKDGAAIDDDVAHFLGISMEKYRRLVQDARLQDAVYLHECTAADDEALIDTLSSADETEQHDLETYLSYGLHLLRTRDQEILRQYYFEGLTLREIGAELGISEGRVSQIMKRATEQMRTQMVAEYR